MIFRSRPAPDTKRQLGSGEIIGLINKQGAHEWRGLPYAAPPVSAARWRAPQAPANWPGTREALSHGHPAPQFRSNGKSVFGNEDCLTASVWAPPVTAEELPVGDEAWPVMVWIHGGGHTVGHAAEQDWSALALEQNIIVVAVQYRLGPLGWFRHQALREEGATAEEQSGNFALLDLIEVLKWVQINASAFGGNPDRVTLFGASAGAANILSLLSSPLSGGLFHAAIVQSAPVLSTSTDQAEHPTDAPDGGDALSSHQVLRALLCRTQNLDEGAAAKRLAAMSMPEIAALLRATSPDQLMSIYPKSLGPVYQLPVNFRDGHVLPADPLPEAFRRGHFARVPILIGSNRDEVNLFLLAQDRALKRVFRFPIGLRDPVRYALLSEYGSRRWRARGVDELAGALRSAGHQQIFSYRMDWDEFRQVLSLDLKRLMGAMHGVELLFLSGSGGLFTKLFRPDALAAAQTLGIAMRSYWAEFAAVGDPGRGREHRLPRWPSWSDSETESAFLIFDEPDDGGIRLAKSRESDAALMEEMSRDSRFACACERCEAMAGFAAGILPDVNILPPLCAQFISDDGRLACP